MQKQTVPLFRVLLIALASLFSFLPCVSNGAPLPSEAQILWNFEHTYWQYVEENDLTAYRKLWHKDFLGWPYVSEAPVHKDHITDWITSRTGNGQSFHLLEFKPAAIQITGDVAVVYYWVTAKWVNKAGAGTPITTRVTHTWVKTSEGWLIVGGMSTLESANPHD
jgi:ketosteroid isomerase-like protein